MTSATQTLPENYTQRDKIALSKNKKLLILLNVAGMILFMVTFLLLAFLCVSVHPELRDGLEIDNILFVVLLMVLSIIMLLAHEAIHGLFFWVFTRSRPKFAVRLTYAYAAAPDWFIPANQYLIVGLSPLVIIDLICVLIILIAPASWALFAALIAALNTGGAIGDLWIVSKLSREYRTTLIQDTGDSVSYFSPQVE